MKTLETLENKINNLIDLVQELKNDNVSLVEEKHSLKEQLQTMEKAMLNDNRNLNDLKKEREKTRHFVDSLIKDIDAIVVRESKS